MTNVAWVLTYESYTGDEFLGVFGTRDAAIAAAENEINPPSRPNGWKREEVSPTEVRWHGHHDMDIFVVRGHSLDEKKVELG